MAVNRDKPDRWKEDIATSVDMYNDWFVTFAPEAYRETRQQTSEDVEASLRATGYLTDISVTLLRRHPGVLPTLRMSTCPPLAVDRLIGLAGVPPNLVRTMEKKHRLPPRMPQHQLESSLADISRVFQKMLDPDIFVWLTREDDPTNQEIYRASTIVADRLCGSVANPIIRNAQEQRQLARIATWLKGRSYTHIPSAAAAIYYSIPPGTFAFRVPLLTQNPRTGKRVTVPVDVAVMPKPTSGAKLPLLIEAKSAGDFTNVNKRRKEESEKLRNLQNTYGRDVRYVLFLCGYFDSGYLGYEAAEGIDWVWEHRIRDLQEFGL